MKILSLHCDYIRFKPLKKALKEPEQLSKDEEKEKEIKECLVILASVEKSDNSETVNKLVKSIEDIASQVKCKTIVLYPYAHLSSNLASPQAAIETLKAAEQQLKKNFSVTRAPFGYYKEFELKCKGHPLSELSRDISSEATGKEIRQTTKIPVKDEVYNSKQLLDQISKSRLDTSKLKDNDHRILGQALDLFSFSETAPGMVFWHNNGLTIYNELMSYCREELKKAGYQEVSTPFVLDKRLWQISGHWEKYKENIFLTEYEGRQFAVKPMNCPGGILIFKTRPRSYKELPMRVAEYGIIHRQELSGVLAGLFRVIKFTQDDAHHYCREEDLESEISAILELISKVYDKFKFNYHIELSTRSEKRIGTDAQWEKAEKVLESVLKKRKINYKLNKGDGAFYGPKIDFHLKDSLGRTWQCGTIQLDFAMPERFDLAYTDKDNKQKRPVMLHRTVLGSFERFIGILLEHTNGHLPTWLSPIQAIVLSFTDRNAKACGKFMKKAQETIPELRIESDLRDMTVNSKVKAAELKKIPYIIVIGDKEEESKTLAIRKHGVKEVKFGVNEDNFIEEIKAEIQKRS